MGSWQLRIAVAIDARSPAGEQLEHTRVVELGLELRGECGA